MTDLHEAGPDELDGWDARTVDVAGGHVYQSRTWGEYRRRHGWRVRFLVYDDGSGVLVAERPWPVIGGSGAYIARGPVSAGEPAERTANRLRAAADWLAGHGVDVVSSDAEIAASTGYPAMLERRGFRPIEEVQPSRHRVSLPLDPAADAESVFGAFTKSLRQTIRTAEHRGVRIVRYDARPSANPGLDGLFEEPPLDAGSPAALAPVFARFHDAIAKTAVRRHFPVPPRSQLVDASSHAVAAGLAFHLETYGTDGELVSASLFYRHGRRISYGLSADRVDRRQAYPGVVQLALWRAIQVAIAEGCDEFDLAGVDVLGARDRPAPGDEMHGLLAMKERFGGRWVELSGNHEWVARPWRYGVGRVVARLRRLT